MTITAALVVYAIAWFVCLYIVLPQRIRSQAEDRSVVPGTPASAPSDPRMGRRFLIATIAASVIWAVVVAIILSGVVSIDDFGFLPA